MCGDTWINPKGHDIAMRRCVGRIGLGLGIILFIFLNFLALSPQGRTIVSSALFVTQVLPIPLKPQEWVTADPVLESVTFSLADSDAVADIYRVPDGGKRAGILVFLGVDPAPRDDDRVVNLGNGLARAGFVVMFPWSETMMGKRIHPSEPDNLVHAFKYLRGLDYVDSDRVGMGGFCVGGSISVVAASDPRISDDVQFVSSFGAYYNGYDLLKQIASNRSIYQQTIEHWDPNHLTEEVFANQLVEGLEDGREKELISGIFLDDGGKLRKGVTILEGSAKSQELGELSKEGNAAFRILASVAANSDQDKLTVKEAEGYMQELPPVFLAELGEISPSTNIGNLKARLLIAHDREDDLVPSEESHRLADAISERGDLHYTEFSFFSHVTPDKQVGPFTFVKEAFKLFRYTYSIIRVAD